MFTVIFSLLALIVFGRYGFLCAALMMVAVHTYRFLYLGIFPWEPFFKDGGEQ